MNLIHRILSRWWARIAIFLVIETIIVLLFNLYYSIYFFYLLYLQVLLVSIVIESGRKKAKFWTIGIRFDKWMLKDIGISGFLLISFSLLVFLIAISFGAKISINTDSYHKIDSFTFNILPIFMWIFIRALNEEFLFRGIIFQALLERYGGIISVFGFSIIFAGVHTFNPDYTVISFINTFLINILLSIMYIQTRSLWQPIFFHFFWNFILAVFLGSKVSGLDLAPPIIELELEKLPAWLFGGEYGLEGGILTTFAVPFFLIIVLKWSSVSPYMAARLFKMQYFQSLILNKAKLLKN